jgi:hypothetical protein
VNVVRSMFALPTTAMRGRLAIMRDRGACELDSRENRECSYAWRRCQCTPPLCFLPKCMNLLHLAIGIPGKILITRLLKSLFFSRKYWWRSKPRKCKDGEAQTWAHGSLSVPSVCTEYGAYGKVRSRENSIPDFGQGDRGSSAPRFNPRRRADVAVLCSRVFTVFAGSEL